MRSADACFVIRSTELGLEEHILSELDMSVCSKVVEELRSQNQSKLDSDLETIREGTQELDVPRTKSEVEEKIERFLGRSELTSLESDERESLENVGYYTLSKLDEGETHLIANSVMNDFEILTDDFEAYRLASRISKREVKCLTEVIILDIDVDREMKEEAVEILDLEFLNYDELSTAKASELSQMVDNFLGPVFQSI